MNRKLVPYLGISSIALLALTACGNTEENQSPESAEPEVVESEAPNEEAVNSDEDADAVETDAETDEGGDLPDTPSAYSTLTIEGDEGALPEGEEGEVSVVAISEPESSTSFPFILQNRTDEAVSRVEVSGRAIGSDGETLGTGGSHMVTPNVVEPGAYAFGYVYVDSSDMSLPAGASIPELRVDFTEGLGDFENVIGLDIENFEELPNGDLTGDAVNPHDEVVTGPIGIDSVCLSGDDRVTYNSTYSENDTVSAGEAAIWTISNYSGDSAECAVRLVGASGFSE